MTETILFFLAVVVAILLFFALRRDEKKAIEYRCPNKERANKLAERLGVKIAGNLPVYLWSLPILEKLVERVEAIENKEHSL